MKKKVLSFCLLIMLALHSSFVLAKQPISLKKVLSLAEKNSPQLTASQFRELAAQKAIDYAKANYYPTLNLEGIDSTGFPASNGLVGVGGLMDSPYRSGAAGGVVAEQIIYDFGRTAYKVQTSKYQAEYSQADTQVTAYQVKLLALETYYECSGYRNQRDAWAQLRKDSAVITREITQFVNTGQRSIVDKYLSQAQTEEAETAYAFFNERLQDSRHRLAIIMGVPDKSFSCPALPVHMNLPIYNNDIYSSPLYERAVDDEKISEAKLGEAKANYYPKIVAEASAGDMEKARLVPRQGYAVGIGVVVPLVDLHINAQTKQAQDNLLAKQQDINAEEQYLEETNAQYDIIIESAKVRLNHLNTELDLAITAFNVAKKRYFSYEGDVIDLREAFRNLARTESQIIDTQTELLQAKGAKYLLNGA